jgi:hypothetical protein
LGPKTLRTIRSGQALEVQNAEFSMNYIECESTPPIITRLPEGRAEPS